MPVCVHMFVCVCLVCLCVCVHLCVCACMCVHVLCVCTCLCAPIFVCPLMDLRPDQVVYLPLTLCCLRLSIAPHPTPRSRRSIETGNGWVVYTQPERLAYCGLNKRAEVFLLCLLSVCFFACLLRPA